MRAAINRQQSHSTKMQQLANSKRNLFVLTIILAGLVYFHMRIQRSPRPNLASLGLPNVQESFVFSPPPASVNLYGGQGGAYPATTGLQQGKRPSTTASEEVPWSNAAAAAEAAAAIAGAQVHQSNKPALDANLPQWQKDVLNWQMLESQQAGQPLGYSAPLQGNSIHQKEDTVPVYAAAPAKPRNGLDSTMCSAMLHDNSHIFRRMWAAEAWGRQDLDAPPCWAINREANGERKPQLAETYFSETMAGTHCDSNWFEGNVGTLGHAGQAPSFLNAAPALLGFDESIDDFCAQRLGGWDNAKDFGHAQRCVAADLNILSLYGELSTAYDCFCSHY